MDFEGICASEVQVSSSSSLVEQIWLSITPRQSNMILLLGCLYRSPSSDTLASVQELEQVIQQASGTRHTHLMITGDFNLPQIDWDLGLTAAPESHPSHSFIETIQSCYLYQHVRQPTRFRIGETPNTLDLILTNEEGMVRNLQFLPGLGSSDHVVLLFDLVCFSPSKSHQCLKIHTNYDDLNDSLASVDWSIMHDMNLMECSRFFYHNLASCIESCSVPKRPRPMRNPYMDRRAWRLKKQKIRLWRIYTQTQDILDYARFASCRNKLRTLTRNLRRDYEKQLVSQMKTDPKLFWRYASVRLHTRCQIGDLTAEDGTIARDSLEKADTLSKYFASKFTTEDTGAMPTLESSECTHLCNITITPQLVNQKLAALKPSSSSGPDGIHPKLLISCKDTLSVPLSILFNKSMDSGEVPPEWKLGEVTPIYRKGPTQDPASYRPVSLTSVPSKVLESLARDCILQHMLDSGLLHPAQHGFLPKRSCATQLIEAIEDWSRALDDGNSVDVAYLDFSKAFDSVPHKLLLHKLHAYGIRGKLLQWVEAFLTERSQRIVVQGAKSQWSPVVSGIPQGSVLGPTLFIIFVNDIPTQLHGSVKLFADDAKVYSRVKRPDGQSSVQVDLDALGDWSSRWLLPFNVAKCKVMHLGPAVPQPPHRLNGVPLQEVDREKDLGIIVDQELKFHQQTAAAAAKASQMLAVAKRSFAHIDTFTPPLIYKTLVRPHLEYGNLAWGPFGKTDQKRLERVQRRATRLVPSLKPLAYEERLRALKLPSLYYRRRRGDMIAVYQILSGGMSLDAEELFKRTCFHATRGHGWKLAKPRVRTASRQRAFSVRVVTEWNSLPARVVSAPTLSQFKAELDAHWSNIMYTIP